MKGRVAVAMAVALLGTAAARADVWDLGSDSDNDSGSDNEIVHGLTQVHDLAARAGGTIEDVDWYAFRLPESRSFEIRLDGITGDTAGVGPSLDVIAADGTTVLQSATTVTPSGSARVLRIQSDTTGGTGYATRFVRVANPQCGLACTGDDEYRIHAFDTTLALPRYNNTNGQVTVLVLQNPSSATIGFVAGAFANDGSLLGTIAGQLFPHGSTAINLGAVNGGALNGTSGSLVIRHDGPYLGLAGKGVAVEPATGFTFDTAITAAPR